MSKLFKRLTKLCEPEGRVQFVNKLTIAYLFQITQEKSCDYVWIIDMKKYAIAYHN